MRQPEVKSFSCNYFLTLSNLYSSVSLFLNRFLHKNVSKKTKKKNCPVIENVHFRLTNAGKKRPCLSSLLLLITGGCQSSGYGCAEKTLFHEEGTCTESLEQIEINLRVKSHPEPLHVANRVVRHSKLRPYLWRPNHD